MDDDAGVDAEEDADVLAAGVPGGSEPPPPDPPPEHPAAHATASSNATVADLRMWSTVRPVRNEAATVVS